MVDSAGAVIGADSCVGEWLSSVAEGCDGWIEAAAGTGTGET